MWPLSEDGAQPPNLQSAGRGSPKVGKETTPATGKEGDKEGVKEGGKEGSAKKNKRRENLHKNQQEVVTHLDLHATMMALIEQQTGPHPLHCSGCG